MSSRDSKEALANDRTIVFITNIPSEAVPSSDALKGLLREVTTRCLRVLKLDSEPYGMALYASSEDALAACKTDVTVTHNGEPVKLRLRIMKKSKAVLSAVFCQTIAIEGADVNRDELAMTAGLQWSNQCRILPKWCRATAAGEDCPQGMMCRFIHKVKYQSTLQPKRERTEAADDAAPAGSGGAPSSSFRCFSDIALLVPPALQCPKVGVVPLTLVQIQRFVGGDVDELVFLATAEAARLGIAHPYVKVDVKGGAPWDWCLASPAAVAPAPSSSSAPNAITALQSAARRELQRLCPLPNSNIGTPEERDVYFQKVSQSINTVSCFASAEQAVRALAASAGVRRALDAWMRRQSAKAGLGDAAAAVSLVVLPWLPVQSILHELTVFVVNGVVTRVTQRHGMKFVPGVSASDDVRPGAIVKAVIPNLMQLQGFMQSEAARRSTTCALDCIVHGPSAALECTVVSIHDFHTKADQSEVYQQVDRQEQQAAAAAAGGGGAAAAAAAPSELKYTPRYNTTVHQRFPLFSWDQLALLKAES